VVAADKGARQPAVLLLDVEVGSNEYGKKEKDKKKKKEQDLYAAIEPHPNVHSHYFLSLSHFHSPFSRLSSAYISPHFAYVPHLHFKFPFLEFTSSFSQTTKQDKRRKRNLNISTRL
jgi:hypothetical protein